ncbi:MAG: CsoR family transcriptional regulator, copper-sensing transcriptional repressor [Clostridia bacterium]|nr:CsoR family transcriptional regulator, copper-sensing transcriptional repressor [Clostridia bacterium]MDN5374968.1 CsoR family transcriptional regulator, copper-sensing transcriptional repressor [Thermacetogenium sp.]
MNSYEAEKDDLLRRLRKIEGQVRGIQRMIEEGRYCIDVLTQLAAARQGLNRVGMLILDRHIKGCVVNAIRSGEEERAVEELNQVLLRFIR